MNKFMDLTEINQPFFREVIIELEYYNRRNYGLLLDCYYKLRKKPLPLGPPSRQWEYPWSIINSHFSEGQRILDAGCGSSPLLFYLYRRACLCYGLDKKFSYEIYPPSLFSKKRMILTNISKFWPFSFLINFQYPAGLSYSHKALELNIKYIKSDITNISFQDSCFDRIFFNSVLEHLSREEMLRAAEELYRILKPQGLLIATVDYLETGLFWRDFIEASGLSLYGESDFTLPAKGKNIYEVVGFVLQKE